MCSPGKVLGLEPDMWVSVLYLLISLAPQPPYLFTHRMRLGASLVVQMVKNPPAMWETWVQLLGWEDLLEKGTATHSSILTCRIPWTEEPGGLQSMKSQRVWHDWATKHKHTQAQHLNQPVFIEYILLCNLVIFDFKELLLIVYSETENIHEKFTVRKSNEKCYICIMT